MPVTFTTAEADPIQREVIMPRVREFLNTATVTLKYAEREQQVNPNGEFIITYNKEMNNNAASGRPEYTGASTSASALPEARSSQYGRSIVPHKRLYTRAKWSGPVIAATQSKESLVNALVEETKRAALKSKSSVNRQLLGDGRDALAFYVSGAGASSGVVAGEYGGRASDFFEAGDTLVDLIDVTDGGVEQTLVVRRGAASASGRAVTFFDASTGASTNLDADAATGDYFILSGTGIGAGGSAVRYQLMGLDGIISDGNTPIEGANGLQGVPIATVPEFAAIASGSYSATADLTVADMQAILGELDIQSGGDIGGADGIKLILTSQRGLETMVELFRSERIKVNTMELDGGFTGISFNGQYPVVADKHVKLQTFYFWNPESTKLFVLKDWDWEDKDGSMFYRLSGGDQDGLGATLKAYLEFGVIVRNANGVLKGVNMIR
jgi:hypothetical protein